jgi:hypothetical protein
LQPIFPKFEGRNVETWLLASFCPCFSVFGYLQQEQIDSQPTTFSSFWHPECGTLRPVLQTKRPKTHKCCNLGCVFGLLIFLKSLATSVYWAGTYQKGQLNLANFNFRAEVEEDWMKGVWPSHGPVSCSWLQIWLLEFQENQYHKPWG